MRTLISIFVYFTLLQSPPIFGSLVQFGIVLIGIAAYEDYLTIKNKHYCGKTK